MAGLTSHFGIRMRERRLGNLHRAPTAAVLLNGVSVSSEVERALVLLRMGIIDIGKLRDLDPLRSPIDGELLLRAGFLKAALVVARQIETFSGVRSEEHTS